MDDCASRRKLKKRRKSSIRNREPPCWNMLPDLVLEDIFTRLSIRDRYYASLVCQNWNRVFHSPRVWSTFVLQDRTMTRRKYNYYMGYQHTLDHYRTQLCLHRVGRHFRRLIFAPIDNFFNLYEFMTILSNFAEFFCENPLQLVHTLSFSFACRIETEGGSETSTYLDVFGTGGRLLQTLKRLMNDLPGLRHLCLEDLLLERHEAMYLLDDVVQNCCTTMRTLRLINCTRVPCPILHVGVFLSLSELSISPQQLSDDVVYLLASSKIRRLHILQNAYTDMTSSTVSATAWRTIRNSLSKVRIRLGVEGDVKQTIIWQDKAPVKSITYDSTHAKITPQEVITAVEYYMADLELYAHIGLPRFFMPKNFHDRADSSLVYLCRTCPNLKTLFIRERVSTATILLLASSGKKLKQLFVRRNAIIKRADWPKSPDWTDEFYEWLKRTARSYEATQHEVSQILGIPWSPVTDKQYKLLDLYHFL